MTRIVESRQEDPGKRKKRQKRERDVRRIMAPIATHICCKAFNRNTPGVNWNKSTKGDLVEAFGREEYGLGNVEVDAIRDSIMSLMQYYGYK